MTRFPSIRAGAVRDTLAFLDVFEPGAQTKVMERVPAAARDAIISAPRSGWVSIEHDHWTIEAIIAVLGRERAIEFWSASLANLVERPLLRSFVSGMIKVMGREPAVVVTFFVRGWPLAYRDLCDTRYLDVGGQPAIRFETIAPEVQKYSDYFASWEGACRGFAHIAQVKGYVDFMVAPDMTWAQARFTWI
jgi:hypothetical protein